jgi:4-diphosphocytidyl-2-C-methyl-D-erythritol kinase
MTEVRVLSPAKINLFLKILGERSDGYHEIQTLMQLVDLADEILLREAEAGIELRVAGLATGVPESEENLVWRAARLVLQQMGRGGGVSISLYKRIPVGGGLGGGSSNAAATLWGMRALLGLSIPMSQLRDWALLLGSDVPFFLTSGCALAEGRGEVLREVRLARRWAVIIFPGFGISTKWAYSQKKFKLTKGGRKDKNIPLPTVLSGEGIRQPYTNDLEEVVREKYPLINDLKAALLDSGAKMALMSGSGSSVYGIFDDRERAKEAASHWRGRQGYLVHEGTTLDFNPIFGGECSY